MVCVTIAVVGDLFCPGDFAIGGIVFFNVGFAFLERTIVIFSTTIATVLEFGRVFCS